MEKRINSKKKTKVRYHKILFDLDKPFGHKVQRDRSKTIPRKHKYKNIEE
jgi:hypothetical protein